MEISRRQDPRTFQVTNHVTCHIRPVIVGKKLQVTIPVDLYIIKTHLEGCCANTGSQPELVKDRGSPFAGGRAAILRNSFTGDFKSQRRASRTRRKPSG